MTIDPRGRKPLAENLLDASRTEQRRDRETYSEGIGSGGWKEMTDIKLGRRNKKRGELDWKSNHNHTATRW